MNALALACAASHCHAAQGKSHVQLLLPGPVQSLVAGVTSNATYKTLWRSGDNIDGVVMGTLLDVKGQPIKEVNGTTLVPGTEV